jgi:hypothetical protein
MMDYRNPFEYEAASKFTPDDMLDFYIEDFNYSRFVRSRRNIFLVGDRGAGKSMTLIYNSLPVQLHKAIRNGTKPDYSMVGVYVPCNTPLTHKTEYSLLDKFQASVVSEHFLVLSIVYALADTLTHVPDLLKDADEKALRDELEFAVDLPLPASVELLDAIKQAVQREGRMAQKSINEKRQDAFYPEARSFFSLIMPLLTCLKKIPALEDSHFAFMLDDAHDLNPFQIAVMNSWIAYREHSLFSFKVATAKIGKPSLKTSSGGAILEGHDFTTIDMEQPYQNQYSDFGQLARQIVSRRLAKINLSCSPEEFLPANPQFEADLEACREAVKRRAEAKFPEGTSKQRADYVYKYSRAEYFRQRSSKANRPPYSGFDILVHLSTGVIRNLLEPCYWMYDKAVSEKASDKTGNPGVNQIPWAVQTDIIMDRSSRLWERIRAGLDNTIEGCSGEQAKRLYQLFDHLAILFRKRLAEHLSEPRAIVFTISDRDFERTEDLLQLLRIARKAQILYEYTSSAKELGKRETYYVPNRLLWPDRGLDPHGQNARVSLKARDLWAAGDTNKEIPFDPTDNGDTGGLFDEQS